MLKSFYHVETQNGYIISAIEAKLKDKGITIQTNLILNRKANITRAQFYLENNYRFVKAVVEYTDPFYKGSQQDYANIMKYFASMVANLPHRPTLTYITDTSIKNLMKGAKLKFDQRLK